VSENKFKSKHKSIVRCEEGHKIQLLTGISALDQHTLVLLLLLLVQEMRIQLGATALRRWQMTSSSTTARNMLSCWY